MFDIETSVASATYKAGRRTKYKIYVSLPSRSWTIERRHVEFKRLAEALNSCGYGLASVPERRLWGPRTQLTLQRRVEALDIWLHGVLATWKTTTSATQEDEPTAYITKFLCNTEEFFYSSNKTSGANRGLVSLIKARVFRLLRTATRNIVVFIPTKSATPSPTSRNAPPSATFNDVMSTSDKDLSVHEKFVMRESLSKSAQDEDSSHHSAVEAVLFHGNVVDYQELSSDVTVQKVGFDVCERSFNSVSVPPSPKARGVFYKAWSGYTSNVLTYTAKRLLVGQIPMMASADDSWVDSESEGGGSEDEGGDVRNPQVQDERRNWLRSAIMSNPPSPNSEHHVSEDDEGYNSEGWASEAANASYDGGENEAHGSWEGGQVWVVPKDSKLEDDFEDNAFDELDAYEEEYGELIYSDEEDDEEYGEDKARGVMAGEAHSGDDGTEDDDLGQGVETPENDNFAEDRRMEPVMVHSEHLGTASATTNDMGEEKY